MNYGYTRGQAMVRPRPLIASSLVIWTAAFVWTARAFQPGPSTEPAAAAAAPQAQEAPTDEDCQACHDDDAAVRANGTPVVVRTGVFEASVHADVACVDCHADLATTTEWPHAEDLAPVDCATCHDETAAEYRSSVHAQSRAAGSTVAAGCADCHGTHDMRASSDPQSRTYHLNQADTCARCHGSDEIIARGDLPRDVTQAFADSIHGQALSQSGLVVAPTCSSCHGAHDIREPDDPGSRVSPGKVPATCGRCHEGIRTQFEAGVHGSVLAAGQDGAPACQTCHTAHSIRSGASIGWQLSVIQQCGTCHADRMATFKDTFHGQVTNLGFRAVAGCADCHGAHQVLPASDPRSPVAPANLVKTCSKCHEGANQNFVQYDPHADPGNRDRSPALYYTSRFMTVLLASVFGFFGIHTTLWFGREWRTRRERGAGQPGGPGRGGPAGKDAAGDRAE